MVNTTTINIYRVASRILPIKRNLMSHLTWKTGAICWEFVCTRFRTICIKESFMYSIHTSLTNIFKLNGHFYNAPPRFIWTCTQLICIVNVLYYVNWYVEWEKNRTANIIWDSFGPESLTWFRIFVRIISNFSAPTSSTPWRINFILHISQFPLPKDHHCQVCSAWLSSFVVGDLNTKYDVGC